MWCLCGACAFLCVSVCVPVCACVCLRTAADPSVPVWCLCGACVVPVRCLCGWFANYHHQGCVPGSARGNNYQNPGLLGSAGGAQLPEPWCAWFGPGKQLPEPWCVWFDRETITRTLGVLGSAGGNNYQSPGVLGSALG